MQPPKPQGWVLPAVDADAPLRLGDRVRQGLPGPDGDPARRPRRRSACSSRRQFGLGSARRSRRRSSTATPAPILLILAVGVCFAGAANSVRELIKERVIYERERATGLSRSAYLMSKVIVLGVITALPGRASSAPSASPAASCPTEGLILGRPPSSSASPIMALGFTSMMFGLIISVAGEDRREDHAAAGHVRDRPGRLHRLLCSAVRHARRRAVRRG